MSLREAAAVTLSKPGAAVGSGGSCLHNCWAEAMSDPQRLKNGSWKDGIRN